MLQWFSLLIMVWAFNLILTKLTGNFTWSKSLHDKAEAVLSSGRFGSSVYKTLSPFFNHNAPLNATIKWTLRISPALKNVNKIICWATERKRRGGIIFFKNVFIIAANARIVLHKDKLSNSAPTCLEKRNLIQIKIHLKLISSIRDNIAAVTV